MPSVRCKNCQTIIDTNEQQPQVVCPRCGSVYLNPYCPTNNGAPQSQYGNQYDPNGQFAPQQQYAPAQQPYSPQPAPSYNPVQPLGSESIKLLKSMSKSWLMLILAITVTITAVFTLVDLFTHLKGLAMIPNIIKIILNIVLCTGVWLIFTRGRTDNNNPSGFNCVNGYITTITVFISIIVSLILIVVFMTFGIVSEIAGDLPLGDGVNLNTILIIAIFLLVAVMIVISLFLDSLRKILKSAKCTLERKPEPHANYILAAVMLLLIGVVKFAWIFVTGAISGFMTELLGALSENLSGLGSLVGKLSFGSNWSSILVDVCGMLNYILGGVLIIIYYVKKKKLNEPSPML